MGWILQGKIECVNENGTETTVFRMRDADAPDGTYRYKFILANGDRVLSFGTNTFFITSCGQHLRRKTMFKTIRGGKSPVSESREPLQGRSSSAGVQAS